MFDSYDPNDTEAYCYDDRNQQMSDDEPRGTYVPIVERPENTHVGFSDPDPAIDDTEPVATFE